MTNTGAYLVIIDDNYKEEEIPTISRAEIEEFKNLLEVYNNGH